MRSTIGMFDMPLVNNRNLYLNDGADAGRKLWEEKRAMERAEKRGEARGFPEEITDLKQLASAIDRAGSIYGNESVRVSEAHYQQKDHYLRAGKRKLSRISESLNCAGWDAGFFYLYCRTDRIDWAILHKWMRAHRMKISARK